MSSPNDNEEIARLKQEIATLKKKDVRRELEAHGMKFLEKENYVFPDDPEIKATYLETMFDKLEDENTQIAIEGGELVVLDKDGRPKENKEGTRDITLDDHLRATATRFFKKAVAKPAAGNGHAAWTPPAPPKEFYPKPRDYSDMPDIQTAEDFYQALNSRPSPAQFRALKDRMPELRAKGILPPPGGKVDPKQQALDDYYAELNATRDPAVLKQVREKYKKVLESQ